MLVPSKLVVLRRTLGVLVVTLAALSSAYAQSSGAVRGTVTVAGSKSPLAGAVVRLIPKRAGIRIVGKTDKSGRFRLDAAPGLYRVTVECDGYVSEEVATLEIASRDTVLLEIPVRPAP